MQKQQEAQRDEDDMQAAPKYKKLQQNTLPFSGEMPYLSEGQNAGCNAESFSRRT